ncbi:MAG: nucleoside phosphorylase [Cytophagales bacterium]|nr:nucleoside phosphorylase [Bernardetiaceae bacterium]MDW8210746.1 nucleoside phosphorylase [Cytophagales bacterium]
MLASAELLLHPDGSVYHLCLQPEHIAPVLIVVGDPERVPKVSRYFDSIEFTTSKREFVTHTGYVSNKRITVISSGIGPDNVEILMTELDALANIDLANRAIKPTCQTLTIIRLGTSGALQADIPLGSRLISQAAMGLDNLMHFYHLPQSAEEKAFCTAFQKAVALPFCPYRVSADENLINIFAEGSLQGITLTAPGFYAPQGRQLRAPHALPNFLNRCQQFAFYQERLTNFEMETAAYYAFARLLGHRAVSLNAIIANRVHQTFDPNPEKTINQLICFALEKIASANL